MIINNAIIANNANVISNPGVELSPPVADISLRLTVSSFVIEPPKFSYLLKINSVY